MTDKNSFETIELFKPVPLIQIDGNEPMDVKEEANAAQVSVETPVVNSVADPKPVAEPDKAVISSKWDEIHKKCQPEYYQPDIDVQYNNGGPERGSSPNAADIDLSFFYNNAGELKRNRDRGVRKRDVYLVAGVFFLASVVAFIAFMRGATRRSNENQINNAVQKEIATNDYARQDVVYGTFYFNSTGTQANEFFDISPEVIECTEPFERILFFEYTPKEADKVLRVEVEMLDSYGNSLGTVVAFKKNVPAGETAIIDVPFGIDQFTELNGITYNINMEGYTLQTPEDDKNIVSTEQADDMLYVSIEGGLNVSKDAFVVFYKNGRVCSVMCGTPGYNSNGIASFYLGDIDYDSYEVFY